MKRVALARLLQMDASLLLLDEPFAGLDAATAASFARDLDRLRTDWGKTVLVVEHRNDTVYRMADRVWVMNAGNISESAKTRG